MMTNRFWGSLGVLSLMLIGTLALVYPASALADPARRSLELELDEVPGSTGYEVRVTRILADKTKKPPVVFKIEGTKWSAKLVPGKYEMEVRSLDERHVPGAWSDPQEFIVKLPAAEMVSPTMDASIKSDDDKNEKVSFEWSAVEGAAKYKLRIMNPDLTVVQETLEKDTSVKVKLPVGKQYRWIVIPVMDDESEGETNQSGPRTFEVVGGKLEKPKILPIDDVSTTELVWSAPEYATQYKFIMEVQDNLGWKPFDIKTVKAVHRAFRNAIPSGKYRISIVAQGDRRGDSDPATIEFKTTYLNSRSPAAVEQVKSEGAFETKSPIFAEASYYVSFVNYQGQNNDSVSYSTSFKNVIGGTGRLGIGTWFSEDSQIGIMTTADMSGFTFQNADGSTSNPLYYSQSLQGVYRLRLGGVGQLRINFGAEYRTLPVVLSDNPNGSTPSSRESMQITIDPLIGLTLSHGFTRRLGAQFSLQISDSLIGVSMPTSGSNVPTLSADASLLGSLKLTSSLVGFAGIAYRDQKDQYSLLSTSSGGGANSSEIQGAYFNLLLEYGF